jgi:uncharacterized LabA/DUF88 family protein
MSNSFKIAVFIDYDNIEMSLEELFGRGAEVDWGRVLQIASSIGRVIVRRAYADWSQVHERKQRELLGQGLELVYVNSRRGKNAADIRIVIDTMELLNNAQSEFSHVLLVSGDGDFTELVHRLRTHGKVVIGMGVSGTSADFLVGACDKFMYYDKLSGISKPKKSSQSRQASENTPAPTTPEGKLEQYLRILLDHKIRMTPTEKRPEIIFKLYELKKNNPDLTFKQLKEEALAYYAKNDPGIEPTSINDIAHQLFHTFCFVFEDDTGERILDRKMSFNPEIRKAPDLLDMCDRRILQTLATALNGPDKVDREIAARLLYGNVRNPRMVEHVQDLLTAEP